MQDSAEYEGQRRICRAAQNMKDSAEYEGQRRICRTAQNMKDSAEYAGQRRICRTEKNIQDSVEYAGQRRICRTEKNIQDSVEYAGQRRIWRKAQNWLARKKIDACAQYWGHNPLRSAYTLAQKTRELFPINLKICRRPVTKSCMGKRAKFFFFYEPLMDLFENYFFFNSVRSWLIGRYIYIGKQVSSFIHHITRFSAVGTPALPPCKVINADQYALYEYIQSPDTVMFPIRIISCYEYSVW